MLFVLRNIKVICYFFVADTTFDESIANDENLNPNITVRIALRSGEIKSKAGVAEKWVRAEVRTPKSKRGNGGK